MKNSKGFTLVELLATIGIIGLIAGIGVVAYSSLIGQSEKRVYESYEATMHAEAINLLSTHVELLPKNNQKRKYYLNDLKIEPINNPKDANDFCSSSYVEVTRTNTATGLDSFTYKVCLICNDYNSNGSKCKTYEN